MRIPAHSGFKIQCGMGIVGNAGPFLKGLPHLISDGLEQRLSLIRRPRTSISIFPLLLEHLGMKGNGVRASQCERRVPLPH